MSGGGAMSGESNILVKTIEAMMKVAEKVEKAINDGVDDSVKEVIEEVIKQKMENVDNEIRSVVRGVAALLGLDEDRLLKEVLRLEGCIVERCIRQDERLAVEDMVERIAEILVDHSAWDEYYTERAPSAYRYAAAVALWMLFARYHLGGLVRSDCPLFGNDVAAAIAMFLATRYAKPIADTLRNIARRNLNIVSACVVA
jgi:hypothetical protein